MVQNFFTIDKTPLRILMDRKLSDYSKRRGKVNRVLEIGSGKNTYKRMFNCDQFVRTDIEKRDKIESFASVLDLPFKPEFDLVLCLNVLEHVSEPFKAVEEVKNCLKIGGSAIFYTPFLFPLHDKVDYWRFSDLAYKLLLKDYKDITINKIGPGKFALGFFVEAKK